MMTQAVVLNCPNYTMLKQPLEIERYECKPASDKTFQLSKIKLNVAILPISYTTNQHNCRLSLEAFSKLILALYRGQTYEIL